MMPYVPKYGGTREQTTVPAGLGGVFVFRNAFGCCLLPFSGSKKNRWRRVANIPGPPV